MIPQPAGLLTPVWHDLGDGRAYKFLVWAPDFSLPGNARWAHLQHLIKTQPIVGAIVRHPCRTETGLYEGGINFRTELTVAAWDGQNGFNPRILWEVESWEPLTLSPSLLSHCPCNHHGYIRQGRWVPA